MQNFCLSKLIWRTGSPRPGDSSTAKSSTPSSTTPMTQSSPFLIPRNKVSVAMLMNISLINVYSVNPLSHSRNIMLNSFYQWPKFIIIQISMKKIQIKNILNWIFTQSFLTRRLHFTKMVNFKYLLFSFLFNIYIYVLVLHLLNQMIPFHITLPHFVISAKISLFFCKQVTGICSIDYLFSTFWPSFINNIKNLTVSTYCR